MSGWWMTSIKEAAPSDTTKQSKLSLMSSQVSQGQHAKIILLLVLSLFAFNKPPDHPSFQSKTPLSDI